MLYCYSLKLLFKVFDFSKNGYYFLLVSKWFCYIRVVQELLQDKINYFLTYMKVYLLMVLPRFMKILFTNNIDIKIRIYLLFKHFYDKPILSIFFSYLLSCCRFWLWIVNYIPYFIFFEYDLRKIGLLYIIFKISKFFTLVIFVQFDSHCSTDTLFYWCANKISQLDKLLD